MDKTFILLVLNLATLISAQNYFYPNLDPNGFVGEEEIIQVDDTEPFNPGPLPYPNLNFPSGDYFEDFDINGNLISNTTNGFAPIIVPQPPVWPNYVYPQRVNKVVPQVTLQNNSYSSPFESVHRHDSQQKNQTTIVVTHTIIRPKQKPKTIIEIFKDPSQSGENITLTDPENNVFEFNTSLVNSYSKPTERVEPSLWIFSQATTPSPIALDEEYIRSQESIEHATSTTEATGDSKSPENNNSASLENPIDPNSVTREERPSSSNEADENDDYDDTLQQDEKANKTIAKIPAWIRNKYFTTPKFLAFDPPTTTARPSEDVSKFLWFRTESTSTEGVRAITPSRNRVTTQAVTEDPISKPIRPWSFFKK